MRVTIDSLAHGGDSVARLDDGRVAFVRGGCPGDVAEIEVTADHGRRVDARILTVLEPSSDRIDASCPYFGECGGCQWQHVAMSAQLEGKTRMVSDAFARIGKLAAEVTPTRPSPLAYGYRNKVEFVVDEQVRNVRLGLHRLGEQTLVPVERCLLLPQAVSDAPRALAGALRYLSSRHGALGLRRVSVRTSGITDQTEVALWTDPGSFPRQMAAKTITDATGATSVVRVLVKGSDKERRIAGVEVLGGRGNWTERLSRQRLTVSAPSFFQVNTGAAESLVASVLGRLDPRPDDRVLDMYSGVGTFTLPLAAAASEVVAVESSRYALADLRRNLELAGLDADVVGGDAARELPELGRFDLAVIDPPRSGLHPDAIGVLAETGARRLAYVSCDPPTLARDAARLVTVGYTVSHVEPHDLFPQTYHVETVAVFDRAVG